MFMSNSISLRPLSTTDEELISFLTNSKEVTEHGFLNHLFPQSDIQTKNRLERWLKDQFFQKNMVILYDSNSVGIAQIHNIDYINRKCELGMLIHPEFQRKKIGTEVTKKLLTIVFDELNLNKIEIEIAANNYASIKLIEKFGFKNEGTKQQSIYKNGNYQDVVLYGLLRRQFES